MSKELTPLQAFNNLCAHLDYDTTDYMFNGSCEEDAEIIETELKRIPNLEKALRLEIENSAQLNNERIKDLKKVQALEIIKEHRLDIDWFLQFVKQDISYQHYVYCVEQSNNAFAKRFLLSKEEYELLKEFLK